MGKLNDLYIFKLVAYGTIGKNNFGCNLLYFGSIGDHRTLEERDISPRSMSEASVDTVIGVNPHAKPDRTDARI